MKITQLFKEKKPLLSFEVFPPKPDYPIETIYRTLGELRDLAPHFIGVTYGAGGGNRWRTVEIASRVKNEEKIEALAHLTCIRHSREEIEEISQRLRRKIENILALWAIRRRMGRRKPILHSGPHPALAPFGGVLHRRCRLPGRPAG